ncbi:hypothetical protein GCM10009838_50520 [Catenulispora subtropica]|uniref:Secreted protein n=1 Tax=Catenulispora subtropica TaxID=450798 RepID=A0ABP5DM94_9ACTN
MVVLLSATALPPVPTAAMPAARAAAASPAASPRPVEMRCMRESFLHAVELRTVPAGMPGPGWCRGRAPCPSSGAER